VCNAIDYAHSCGVLHRDVKPANVIVGRYGETLVVDWGLAKALGRSDPGSGERTMRPSSASGSAETLPGSALGTPACMSPEQAEGDLDRLGPRSDVYSLGATLYCLLTGRPPFAGDDPGAILRAVQQREFRPPRALDATIDPALEGVCLQAMALKPEDRYGTPRALAEDVERWTADEPVGAWREPVWRRARRWARRNRTAVTTAAAAVLVALAGTAIVLVVQARANRDLRQANAQTRRERDQARRNFELAQQNFELARKAVDDYLTRVGQNRLLKEQGLHALRQELLELALDYYRAFLAQRGDDPSLRVETAAAHERVGDIQIELGHPGEALATYDQALALIEPLVRERLGDPVLATAQVRHEAGRLQAFKDISDRDAVATFDRVKRLGEELLASGGGTDELPTILARNYGVAAIILRNAGRIDDALGAGLRALELAERSTRDRPGDLSAARTRLYASNVATDMMHTKGRADEVRRVCEQEIAFGKGRLREHPRDVEIRLWLASLEGTLGEVERERPPDRGPDVPAQFRRHARCTGPRQSPDRSRSFPVGHQPLAPQQPPGRPRPVRGGAAIGSNLNRSPGGMRPRCPILSLLPGKARLQLRKPREGHGQARIAQRGPEVASKVDRDPGDVARNVGSVQPRVLPFAGEHRGRPCGGAGGGPAPAPGCRSGGGHAPASDRDGIRQLRLTENRPRPRLAPRATRLPGPADGFGLSGRPIRPLIISDPFETSTVSRPTRD
jgi:tetratricopeptide (TPR) repeat protein